MTSQPIRVHSRAPLRLGLAGGGTDVSPYSEVHGGRVLNATLAKYVYSEITQRTSESVRFQSTDHDSEDIVPKSFQFSKDSVLPLHKAVYSVMMDEFNRGERISLDLVTYSDAPVGSGLGASSTLVVSMIKAFDLLLNLHLDNYSIAALAHRIERDICGFQGGKQDQYSAAFGGFNFMEFNPGNPLVNQLRVDHTVISELEASLVLFYTGVSRESATIIAEQSDSMKAKSTITLEAMHSMKAEAEIMKGQLLTGDLSGFAGTLAQGWESKKKSASLVSNNWIDGIYEAALNAGASAGKISGAGGGGYMWFMVPIARRAKVVQTLATFQGIVSNCHFTQQGAQAWLQK